MFNEIIEIISADNKFPSPFTHRVMILCHEKNIPYRLNLIPAYDKPAWFIALAPMGQVPVLRTKDLLLYDSQVINEYLDSFSQPSLLPKNAREAAIAKSHIALANEIALEITQLVKQKTVVESDFERLHRLLAFANQKLRGPYFSGENFSLVDVAFISHLLWVQTLERKIWPFSVMEKYAALTRWLHLMQARKSVQATKGENFEEEFLNLLRMRGYISSGELQEIVS